MKRRDFLKITAPLADEIDYWSPPCFLVVNEDRGYKDIREVTEIKPSTSKKTS